MSINVWRVLCGHRRMCESARAGACTITNACLSVSDIFTPSCKFNLPTLPPPVQGGLMKISINIQESRRSPQRPKSQAARRLRDLAASWGLVRLGPLGRRAGVGFRECRTSAGPAFGPGISRVGKCMINVQIRTAIHTGGCCKVGPTSEKGIPFQKKLRPETAEAP